MSGIFELAVIILTATTLGIVAKLLKQPIILAYILSGFLISYFGFLGAESQASFKIFGELGIMFLLFLVGLEINYTSLKLVGKTSFILGIAQTIFTATIGFLIAYYLLHFGNLESLYISLALTFSSTVIVVKLLSEKKDLNSLYGKISVGMLLAQDFIAILILIFLSGLESGVPLNPLSLIFTSIKGIVLFGLMLVLGRNIFPYLFAKIATSPELLFLTSLSWVFLLAALVSKIGFSVEIAGFLAGLALANSWEHFQIAGYIKPLRNFFILIFFVILGSSLQLTNINGVIFPTLIFSLFVLIGNPLIVLIIMGVMGYRRRTSFLTGLTVAQISEFSLILVILGLKVGHLGENVVTIITAVGIITIGLSSYLIIHGEKIFNWLSHPLRIFERRENKEGVLADIEFKKPIILIGFHRVGQSIALNILKEDLLVIEFDPVMIEQLKRHGIDYIFGDITDSEIIENANIVNAKLVISTSPDFNDNRGLLSEIVSIKRTFNRDIKIILRAETEEEAKELYNWGANYVLLPHFTAGQYLGKTIAIDSEMSILETLRKRDLETMRKIEEI